MRNLLFSKLGSLYHKQRDFERSADFYHQAIDSARVAEDHAAEAMAWGDLAWVYADLEKPDEAIRACEQGIRIVARLDPSLEDQVRKECQKFSAF